MTQQAEKPDVYVQVPPDPSPCLCDDKNCEKLGCVKPEDKWWLKAPAQCDLAVDPEFSVSLAGTVYAQARECQNTTPSTVIDIDDDWVIDVHITITSPSPIGICGLWCVSACLESMCGPNPNYYRFPRDSSAEGQYCCCLVETDQFQTDYIIRLCIPNGIVKEDECGAPYEVTVIVTLLSRDRNPNKPDLKDCDPAAYVPFGVACACELPLMTFYDGG